MPLCAGAIPKELGALAELTVLELDNNKLSGDGRLCKKVLIQFSRTCVLRRVGRTHLLENMPTNSIVLTRELVVDKFL